MAKNKSQAGKLIGTIIVSDSFQIDIIKIYVFDNELKFNSKFAYALSKHDDAYNEVMTINDMWSQDLIDKNRIFPLIVNALEKYESELSEYYFTADELNKFGKITTSKDLTPRMDKRYVFFNLLKNYNKIKKIDKKLFEKEVVKSEIGKDYVENYVKTGAKYYCYNLSLNEIEQKYYFMMVEDKITVSFVVK